MLAAGLLPAALILLIRLYDSMKFDCVELILGFLDLSAMVADYGSWVLVRISSTLDASSPETEDADA